MGNLEGIHYSDGWIRSKRPCQFSLDPSTPMAERLKSQSVADSGPDLRSNGDFEGSQRRVPVLSLHRDHCKLPARDDVIQHAGACLVPLLHHLLNLFASRTDRTEIEASPNDVGLQVDVVSKKGAFDQFNLRGASPASGGVVAVVVGRANGRNPHVQRKSQVSSR